MKLRPKVSIITVMYNHEQITLDFLASIARQSYQDLELIVIDNASKEPAKRIQEEYPEVLLIRSDTNLGFAGGNNLGIEAATGEYLLFVNNDTEIPENCIQRLIETYHQFPDTGILCPLLYYFDEPGTLQYGGFTPIHFLTGRNEALLYKSKQSLTGEVIETAYPHGAAMFIKAAHIEKVGPMPEDYFLYYEELDWANRFKAEGLSVRVDYGAFILHKESMSTGKESPLKIYYQTRNRILFMRRNVNAIQYLAFLLYFLSFALPKNLFQYLLHRQKDLAVAFLAGLMWHFGLSKKSFI